MIAPKIERPYVPLYCEGLRVAMRHLDDESLRVFLALTTYADSRGVCFPGIRTLADDTGLRNERIIAALDRLADSGWIQYLRRAERDPITRQMTSNVYLVNPNVFRSRETVSGVDFSLLNVLFRDSPDFRNHNTTNNRIRNQNQESEPKTPPPTNRPSKKAERAVTPKADRSNDSATPTAEQASADSSAQPDQQQREAQTSAKRRTAPPGSAAPPHDLSDYNAPLEESSAEALAEELRAATGNMSAPNARYLVDNFGQRRVKAALRIYRKQTDVFNPAGFVISLLRRKAADPERDLRPDNPADPYESFYLTSDQELGE